MPSQSRYLGNRLHDAVWLKFEAIAREAFLHADAQNNPEERRVWRCLLDLISMLGVRWLSDLRNLVNYRPSVGYLEVTKGNVIQTYSVLRTSSPFSWDILVAQLAKAAYELRQNRSLKDDIAFLSNLAPAFTTVLATLAEDLHADIIARIDGDETWLNERLEFTQSHNGSANGLAWPLS